MKKAFLPPAPSFPEAFDWRGGCTEGLGSAPIKPPAATHSHWEKGGFAVGDLIGTVDLILFPLLPLADESEELFTFIWGKPLDPAIRVEPRQLPFRVRPRVSDPQLPCGIQR